MRTLSSVTLPIFAGQTSILAFTTSSACLPSLSPSIRAPSVAIAVEFVNTAKITMARTIASTATHTATVEDRAPLPQLRLEKRRPKAGELGEDVGISPALRP